MAPLEAVVKKEEEEEGGRSIAIKELIASLASAFRVADIEKATAQLVLRMERASAEREKALLEAARMERVSVERDLKDQVLKLTQERDELEGKYRESVRREDQLKERVSVERELKDKIFKVTRERDELEVKCSESVKREDELKVRVLKLEVENVEIIAKFNALQSCLSMLEKDRELLAEEKRNGVKGCGASRNGEVRVDEGGSGVDVGKSGEAVLEVGMDADLCNGVSTLNADGGDSAKGNGGLLGQGRKEPSSEQVIWIIENDDDCTPSPRQRAEGTGNASSAQLPSSLAATGSSGLKITSSTKPIWENGSKRKRALTTDEQKRMKLDRQPTTSFSNGESRKTLLQGSSSLSSLLTTHVSISSSQDFPAVPIAFISLTERKANEVSKKWPFEADLVAALKKDRSLSLMAICSLYKKARLGSLSVLSSPKRSVDRVDLSRIKALGEFIADGDKHCRPRKSVEELSNHDPKGLDDCEKLSVKYSTELFKMYQLHGDSLFSK